MRKWLFSVIILCLFSVSSATLSAQQDARDLWLAWLYEPDSGTVRVVNQDSAIINEFTLPLAQAFNMYGQNIAVSPSGTHIAYFGIDTSAGTLNQQVFVYDIASAGIVAAHALPASAEATTLDINPTASIFDEASNRLAFGYVMNAQDDPGWEIVVLNYGLDVVELVLNHNSPTAIIVENDLVVPVIQHFDGVNVAFTTIFYAAGGASSYPAFIWDTGADSLRETVIYTSFASDINPATGEVIAPTFTDVLPAAPLPSETGFVIPQNALSAYDPQTGTRSLFFNDPARVIVDAQFVQNGERVAVSRYDAVVDTPGIWSIIERDGTIVGDVQIPLSVFNVFGTRDGFVYLDIEQGATLLSVTTRDNSLASQVIWAGAMQNFPVLVAVHTESAPSESYGAWAQLIASEIIE